MAEDNEEYVLHNFDKLTICDEKRDEQAKSLVTKETAGFTREIIRLSKEIKYFEGFNLSSSVAETGEYYVFKHITQQTPEDHLRVIQLAFPAETSSATTLPELSGLGAWLPLQRLPQVQIRVQSNPFNPGLEGNANRKWNNAIIDEIAHAFAAAFTEFATKDHPLRHSWLESLPYQGMGYPWEDLYRKIIGLLKDKPILQTRKGGIFKRPCQVKTLRACHLHQGTPVFDDLPEELYLASEYDIRHITILRDLGVMDLTWAETLDRLEADLKSPHSKMRSLAPNDEWHVSCANLLLEGLQTDDSVRQRLKLMAVIPVRSLFGFPFWMKPQTEPSTTQPTGDLLGNHNEIYFPTTDGVPIPNLSSLRLVDAQTLSAPKRADFFRAMGVKDCPKQTVLDAIKQFHEEKGRTSSLFGGITEDWNTQFRYLFHHDMNPEALKPWLLVPTESGCMRKASHYLYFPSEQEYDGQKLLGAHSEETNSTAIVSSRKISSFGVISAKDDRVAFILNAILQLVPHDIRCHGLSWIEWLTRATGARYFPPLVENGSASELSLVFLAAVDQRPEKVVGLLQAHWKTEYESVISHNSWITSKLGDLRIMCESGSTTPLSQTYLPLEDLKARTRQLGIESSFPFLRLPVALDSTNYEDWRFLENFGVGSTADIGFYKVVLEKMRDSNLLFDMSKLVNIYGCVAEIAQEQNERDKNELRDYFANTEAIYDNNTNELSPTTPSWVTSVDCVWRGPDAEWFGIQNTLEKWYGGSAHLKDFFSVFLGIPDSKTEDVLDELVALRNWRGTLSTDMAYNSVREIYRYLDETVQSDTDWNLTRRKFDEYQLVLVNRKWYTLSSCVWTSPVPMPGFKRIGDKYFDLEKFFVQRLGIKTTDPAKEEWTKVNVLKELFVQIEKKIPKTEAGDQWSRVLEKLRSGAILPSKASGNFIARKGLEHNFVIFPLARLGDDFPQHSRTIALTLEESQILSSLYCRLGSVDQNLSVTLGHQTTISGATSKSEMLSEYLRAKAYALYCCAAKFKSTTTLHMNTELYDQLSQLDIYTTYKHSQSMIFNLDDSSITMKGNKEYILHETLNEQLNIYVPRDLKHQKGSYLSQLPTLLRQILGISSDKADFPISLILNADNDSLDEVMHEQDIPTVSWIPKPSADGATPREDAERSRSTYKPSMWVRLPPAPGMLQPRERVLVRRRSAGDATQQKKPTFNTTNTGKAAGGLFASGGMGGQVISGTDSTPFEATVVKDDATNKIEHFLTITSQPKYRPYSIEELRLADYAQGRRGRNA